MDHRDHVALTRGGIPSAPGAGAVWADIGAGEGAFTLALADVLGPGARIIAVDRDGGALRANAESMARRFPATQLTTLVADLERPLDLPDLDGLVAANSIHFVPRARQVAAIRSLAAHLRPGAPFIVVEVRRGPWQPVGPTPTLDQRLGAPGC